MCKCGHEEDWHYELPIGKIRDSECELYECVRFRNEGE